MQWSFNPVGGPWVVAVLAAVLLVLSTLRPGLEVSRPKRWTLVALRVFASLLVLFALLRPEVVQTRVERLRSALLVLLDASRSMTVEDSLAGRSRWASAVEMLRQSRSSLESLAEKHDVSLYLFDKSLKPVAGVDALEQLTPDGDASAIGVSLDDLLRNEASERLLGVLLLSDGAQRAVPPLDLAPQVAARRYALEGVPIFPFAFGTPVGGERADVAIDNLVASETVFAGTPTQVTAQLRVRGFANQQLTVQLLWEDKNGEMAVVDAANFIAEPTASQFPVRLEFAPVELGEKRVELRVESPDGEVMTGNNAQATFVTVREGGVRVLYLVGAKRIGGGPGVEQRFVRAALAASPDIAVTRRLLTYEPPRINLTQELARGDYDVFLLDDVDESAFDRDTWADLAVRVREGAGLMMTGGYHSFGAGGHGSTRLAAVLPITPGKYDRQRFDEPLREDVHVDGLLRMTPAEPLGLPHPVMQIGPDPKALWRELPPLTGANLFVRSQLKGNAMVLAVADTPAAQPLLVAGQPGEGRTLALAGDSTWRWRMAGHGEAHRRFWRQAILWLAQKDDSKKNPVWLELAARRVARGAPLELSVGSNPPNPDAPIDLQVVVTQPTGEQQPANLTLGERGGEGVILATDQPGDYMVTVTGVQSGEEFGSVSARFAVPPTDVELDRPAAEPSVMAQLAQITADAGGQALAPEELPDLLAKLAAEEPDAREEVIRRVTYWDTWPFFMLLVGLLSLEWFLRKLWGLI